MSKVFCTEFELNAKLLAMIYLCYTYNFPLCFMLSFYEMYGDSSLFAIKALSCSRMINLTDTNLIKILDQSKRLYKQVLTNISRIREAKEKDEKFKPKLDLDGFTEEYKDFVNKYLLKNIENLYAPVVKLRLSTNDLYKELIS